jgi:hypothetical protein
MAQIGKEGKFWRTRLLRLHDAQRTDRSEWEGRGRVKISGSQTALFMYMRFLHSLLLIITLAICYLLYFRSMSGGSHAVPTETAETRVDLSTKTGKPVPALPAHSQYKADMDRAHEVANQMKASHREADSF